MNVTIDGALSSAPFFNRAFQVQAGLRTVSAPAASQSLQGLNQSGRQHSALSGARFYSSSPAARTSPLDSPAYLAARLEIKMQIDEFTSEWKKGVLDPDAEVSANALTRTARPVFRAMLELGDWAVDLSGLDPKRVSAIHLAVILRATLRRKEKVKGWSDALRVARESLAQHGVDERKILSGLI